MKSGDVIAEIPHPKQWEMLSLIPIAAGLFWLMAQGGFWWTVWTLLPGSMMLATGIALFFMPGDSRITALMAAAGLFGILLAPVVWIISSFGMALLMTATAVMTFLTAGRVGLLCEPAYDGAPALKITHKLSAKAALDEAVIGYFLSSAKIPSGEQAARMCEEALRLESWLQDKGYDHQPAGLHPAPAAPDKVWWEKGRVYKQNYDVLRFDSDFNAPADMPGAARWKTYSGNQHCAVRILRHATPRPWLICIHGYRMGVPALDFSLFSPRWLHHRLGLNIIQPVLPLHGPRRAGLRSGDSFLDGNVADLVLAEMQSLWDLRRALAWLRAEEPNARVGAMGFSLGGYNTALLAGYESKLDFAVAGIPAIDFADLLWRHMPPVHLRYFTSQGLDATRYRNILRAVSPLTQPAQIPADRLMIFAGAGDRLVVPSQPLKLSRHWGVPVRWYPGAHLTVRREPATRETLHEALLRANWTMS